MYVLTKRGIFGRINVDIDVIADPARERPGKALSMSDDDRRQTGNRHPANMKCRTN